MKVSIPTPQPYPPAEYVDPVWAGSSMNSLITFGFNHSGMDGGELDFEIAAYRVDQLSSEEFKELLRLMGRVREDIIAMRKKHEQA